MAMNKIKKGDNVIVITGKDKGRQGQVLSVSGGRAIVEGINIVKKHQKPNPQLDIQGGIIEKEAKIQISNIAILNSQTNKADRVGFKLVDGKKVRVYKSNDEIIDV
jgi:large subunit ribosomal protein L24